MTYTERINAAWRRAELRQPPQNYVNLINSLAGQALNTRESTMCEDLYLLGLVERFSFPIIIDRQIQFYETRYMPLSHRGCDHCDVCEALRGRVAMLEEMVRAKALRYAEVG